MRINRSKPIIFGRREFSGSVSNKPFEVVSPLKKIRNEITETTFGDYVVRVQDAKEGQHNKYRVHISDINDANAK